MNENTHEAFMDPATGAIVVSEIDPEEVEQSLLDTTSAINKFLPIQARRASGVVGGRNP